MGVTGKLRLREVFFGWWTAVASGIMTAWGHGYWSYGFAAYVKPMQAEFGWTRAQTATAASLRSVEGAAEGPFGGILTDKYGPRIVNLVGVIIAGAGLCSMYLIQELWHFLLLWGFIVSLGFNLGMLGPLETAIINWFVKKRGLAISIFRLLLGFGAATVPMFMTMLFIRYGWRMTGVIGGIITWILCIPLTLLFVKPHRPEYYGLMPDGVKSEADSTEATIRAGQDYAEKETGEVEFTIRQAIKTKTFWLINIASIVMRLAFPVVSVHLIAHLIDIGINPVVAAAAVGLYQIIRLPVGFITGIITDKTPTSKLKYIYASSQLMRCLGLITLLFTHGLPMVYLFDVFWGTGHGLHVGSYAAIHSRYYGRKSFASITGLQGQLAIPASFIGPIYVGWVFDTTGSYQAAFKQAALLMSVAVMCWLLASPPKKPQIISDINKIY